MKVYFQFTEEGKQNIIIDNTETNLKALRRTIYLTIHSSLDFEECAHKLLKMELKPGQEVELCHMILDCCAENRTYEKFFGLLAGVRKNFVFNFNSKIKNATNSYKLILINNQSCCKLIFLFEVIFVF